MASSTTNRNHDSLAATATWQWPLVVALLFLAVWSVYSRAFDSPFICDDVPGIVENRSIRQLWPLWGDDSEPGPLQPDRDLPTAGRPLVNLTLAVNYQFSGLAPRGYHVVNALLHCANAMLLLVLVQRTLRLPYFHGRFNQSAVPIAFSAALVWAVHPLSTETVAYSTQRTELLVATCYLATMLCSLNYWTAASPTAAKRWLAFAVFACWAGMTSKEVMVSAPVVVLLFDRTFVAGSLRDAWQKSRPLYLGLFASWLLLLLLNAGGPRSASAGFHLGISPLDWWFTQSMVLVMYLKLAVWPWPLSIHYEPPYLTSFVDAWPYVVPVALGVVTMLVLLWRNRPLGFLFAMFCAILAPTSLVPIVTEIAAERRMYLPLALLLVVAAVGAFLLLSRLNFGPWAARAVVVAAVFVAFAAGTVSAHRLTAYRDELVLWRDVLEHYPRDATAWYNVGTLLLDRGETDEAMQCFEQALAIRPDYAKAECNLGTAYADKGESDQAMSHFRRAIEIRSSYALAYSKLAVELMKADQPEKAAEQFKRGLEWDPNHAQAYNRFASAMLDAGRSEDAATYAAEAVRLRPEFAEAHNNLGTAHAQARRFQDALPHFEAATRLDPELADAQANLMAAYANVGRTVDAINTGRKALAVAQAQHKQDLTTRIEAALAQLESLP